MTRCEKIIEILKTMYPDAKCQLNYENPYTLLVATILSAQSTDKRVNEVTKELFKKVKNPYDMVKLGEANLREIIKTIGFHNTKSKNIINMSKTLIENYEKKGKKGEIVPDTLEELVKLNGVGRKTANVVLSNVFGKPKIAVDTHVSRLAVRLGFTTIKAERDLSNLDLLKIEKDLEANIKKEDLVKAHHMLIFHGREVCKRRNPLCQECKLFDYCLYQNKFGKK